MFAWLDGSAGERREPAFPFNNNKKNYIVDYDQIP